MFTRYSSTLEEARARLGSPTTSAKHDAHKQKFATTEELVSASIRKLKD